MNRKLIAVFLLLALSSAAFAGEKILPYPIHQHKLDNGLNVVTVPFDSPGLAAFYIVVRVGSRNEVEDGVTGFAHFFEHMMFRGTDKYSKEEYSAVLKSTGAAANANTSNDRTIYHMTGNAKKLDVMFELEADRFKNLNYSVHDFKTEAGAVKGEYTKNYASPYQQINEKMLETAFDNHTYKHTTMGFFKDIVDMPNQYDYSRTFFERFYRPEYCTVVIVGDVTPENVNKLAQKYFGDWKPGDYQAEIPVESDQKETRYVHLQNGTIPPYLGLNYKGPAFSDKEIDMPALDVLSSIVFSRTSDLFKKLVFEERKLRFLGGGAFDSRDPNLFQIQASFVSKDDMQYVKDEIVKAIEKVKTDGVDAETLAKTKSNLKYSFAMSIDNPDRIANSLCHYITLTGDPESLNKLYALYDKVTVNDIKMVAKKYFVPEGLTIATISEDENGGVK
ncbi:insulinase family protein [candidate division KSB1 bacterium]|nr:insulinase family protein [candidate division KSB1 bacterium]